MEPQARPKLVHEIRREWAKQVWECNPNPLEAVIQFTDGVEDQVRQVLAVEIAEFEKRWQLYAEMDRAEKAKQS